MPNTRPLYALALTLLSCVLPLAAQSSLTGSVGGTVYDAHRAVVPLARVTLTSAESGESVSATSSLVGRFRLLDLKPGEYSLRVEAPGFAPYRAGRLLIEVGRLTEVSVPLAVAGRPESLEVRDEAPAVNTTQADFASNIGRAEIDNLPINGRRWSNFALLTPTATLDGNFGLISFRGINGLMNNSTVDGADNNQAFFSEERGRTRISYIISQASVREFQVNTSNFSAEFGRAAGAVINSVTRSGGQRTRGEAFYFMRDNTLGATNAFTVIPYQLADGNWSTRTIKPLDRRQQFGSALGGPLLHKRLFYFANFDVQRRDFPAVAAARYSDSFFAAPCVTRTHYGRLSAANQAAVRVCSSDELNTLLHHAMPAGSTDSDAIAAWQAGTDYLVGLLGEVPRTADHQIFFTRLDGHLSSRHALSMTYNRARWSSPKGVQSQPVLYLGTHSFGYDSVKVDMFTARLISTLNPHTAAELRYSVGRDFESQEPQKPAPGEPVGPSGFAPAVNVLSDSTGFAFGTPATLPRRALPDEWRNQLTAAIHWTHRSHLLKAGVDLNFVHDAMNNLYAANGRYNYNYRDYFMADLYQWQHATNTGFRGYSSYTQGFGDPSFDFHTLDTSLYLQDEWRPLRRLTLNFGLRYEYERLPAPQTPNSLLPSTASLPSDGNNVEPRFGFAWDVLGDGRMALRGGYGLYNGRIINSTIASALANTGTLRGQRSYMYCYQVTSYCAMQGPIFPAVVTADPWTSRVGGDVAVFARNMQLPQIHQADLILERQLARNTVLSASYLMALGRELPNFIDTNLDPSTRTNVTYTFAPDYYTGVPGPYNGHTLTVPVYTTRINPNFESITEIRSNVNSSYHALVLSLQHHASAGLGFRLHYTWAHAIDDNQNSTTFTTYNNTLSPAPFTYLLDGTAHTVTHPDRGNSNHDVRQRFTASLHWSPRPPRRLSPQLSAALSHWTIAPVVHIATGRPFSDSVSGDAPIDTCSGCLGFMGTGGQNRLPFLGRNTFRYGLLANVDLRLARSFAFGEGRRLELMAEAFNLFNHQVVTDRSDSYYSVYHSSLEYDSGFDTPTAAANTVYRERQIQLGVRYRF